MGKLSRVINYTLALLVVLGVWSIRYPALTQNPINIFFGSTPASVNSGGKDGGTQRVTLATDQVQLTNKLLVTPDANAQVDVNKVAGTATSVNSGNKDAGTQRNILATDSPSLANYGQGAQDTAPPAGLLNNGVTTANALPTAATVTNLARQLADKFGRIIVLPALRDLTAVQATTISASTSETTIVTAAASTFNDIACLVINNTSASTSARIDIRDTTGGSITFPLYTTGGVNPVTGFCPGGGIIVPQTTVNTNWTAQSSASVTDLRIFVIYVKNK